MRATFSNDQVTFRDHAILIIGSIALISASVFGVGMVISTKESARSRRHADGLSRGAINQAGNGRLGNLRRRNIINSK